MNSFRDSLRRQLDRLKVKVEQHLVRAGAQEGSGGDATARSETAAAESSEPKYSGHKRIHFDSSTVQYLQAKLQDDIVDAKEPLILSLIHTVYEELKQLHSSLRVINQVLETGAKTPNLDKAQEFFKDMAALKSKLQT